MYQREPASAAYYARPFSYRDGVLSVPPGAALEERVPRVSCRPTRSNWGVMSSFAKNLRDSRHRL